MFFIDKNKTLIYFLEDTGYSDAQLMIINYSKPVDGNNSDLVTLDGINQSANISDGTIQDFIVNSTSTDASIVFTAPTIPIGTTIKTVTLFGV